MRGARFVINAIQVGLYDPCTIIDFEVPKKYGLRQTIGDTLGIGGIMRALRTIPVMDDFAKDMRGGMPQRAVPELYQPHGHAQRAICSATPALRPWVCATACRSALKSC